MSSRRAGEACTGKGSTAQKKREEHGVLICGVLNLRPQPVTTLPHVDRGGGRRAVSCDVYIYWRPLSPALGTLSRVVMAEGTNGSGYHLSPQLAAEAVALAAEHPAASTAEVRHAQIHVFSNGAVAGVRYRHGHAWNGKRRHGVSFGKVAPGVTSEPHRMTKSRPS
ncbi:hypothetical protein BQ8794_240226 [Mesorhizobium prunaredense]|uniref:Uncharacterized protein n=1 Tax=Mesorhizobium prunaredense TaxID=1631249 RepID=A0A1R3VB50_9HYPH|nr:hypothetical protein BQ8794_240226 [Mesorhizobium prunaredense]